MDAQNRLLDLIRSSHSPLLCPQALEHSQELADHLPLIRRHVGPRAWYLCLEAAEHSEAGLRGPGHR